MIDQDTPQDIADFITDLQRQEVAAKTITSYRSDLPGFARWSSTPARSGAAHAAPDCCLCLSPGRDGRRGTWLGRAKKR